jgi:hypothetical protein
LRKYLEKNYLSIWEIGIIGLLGGFGVVGFFGIIGGLGFIGKDKGIENGCELVVFLVIFISGSVQSNHQPSRIDVFAIAKLFE